MDTVMKKLELNDPHCFFEKKSHVKKTFPRKGAQGWCLGKRLFTIANCTSIDLTPSPSCRLQLTHQTAFMTIFFVVKRGDRIMRPLRRRYIQTNYTKTYRWRQAVKAIKIAFDKQNKRIQLQTHCASFGFQTCV